MWLVPEVSIADPGQFMSGREMYLEGDGRF